MVNLVYHVKEANDVSYNLVLIRNANQNVKIPVSRVVRKSVVLFAHMVAGNPV